MYILFTQIIELGDYSKRKVEKLQKASKKVSFIICSYNCNTA